MMDINYKKNNRKFEMFYYFMVSLNRDYALIKLKC